MKPIVFIERNNFIKSLFFFHKLEVKKHKISTTKKLLIKWVQQIQVRM